MTNTDNLLVGNPARAFMTIGIASRLQAFRNSNQNLQSFCQIQEDGEAASRCYWSITILEQAFSPRLRHGAFERRQSYANAYPPSSPAPPAIGVKTNELYGQLTRAAPASSIEVDGDGIKDLGIEAYCIRLISIWGDVTAYLLEIQCGKAENSWSPTSTNTQLNFQMHDCETQVASPHLFRHASPLKRSSAELLEHQEYWAPWALMQIASHAIPAILNHPFIHLIATRPHEGHRTIRPTFYLQQTVDLALFHAGWVAQLLLIFDHFPFEITNPVIGHLITATATVFWIFQFSRDVAVSVKAKEDLGKCERFLERMAPKWPHLAQKVCFYLEDAFKFAPFGHEVLFLLTCWKSFVNTNSIISLSSFKSSRPKSKEGGMTIRAATRAPIGVDGKAPRQRLPSHFAPPIYGHFSIPTSRDWLRMTCNLLPVEIT